MKRIHYILLIFGILISCKNDKCNVIFKTSGNLTLVDTSNENHHEFKTYDSTNRMSIFPIYYLGKVKDTIKLRKKPISIFEFRENKYENRNFAFPDSNKIKIIVDTNFNLTHTEYYKHYSKDSKLIIDSSRTFYAYPIFIYNLSDSLINIANFNELRYTVRQAKNEFGNWVDIEKPIRYSCGTGGRTLAIKPKQLLIAKLERFNGQIKTECRLKFLFFSSDTIYSNTYFEHLDKRQLVGIF